MLGRIHILAAQRLEPCTDGMADGRDKRDCGRAAVCADCADSVDLLDGGGSMRDKAKDAKREKCPGCGRMCIGKQAMWNAIDGAGFQIFAFNCAACGAVWMKAAAPMPQKKDFEKMLARAFCADKL